MGDVDDLVQLTHRYFRGVDDADLDLLASCLSPDIVADHSMVGHIEGLDSFCAVIDNLPPEIVTLQHYLTNHEVELDGDKALVRAHLFAQHVVTVGDETTLMPGGGRYLFQCERANGKWRIAYLQNRVTWYHPDLSQIFISPR